MTIFYDGPSPPPGTFDAILAIPLGIKDLGFGPRNYPSLVTSSPAALSANLRTYFQSLPVRSYSRRIVQAFADQVEVSHHWPKLHSNLKNEMDVSDGRSYHPLASRKPPVEHFYIQVYWYLQHLNLSPPRLSNIPQAKKHICTTQSTTVSPLISTSPGYYLQRMHIGKMFATRCMPISLL